MTLEEHLKKIDQLADAATPGPWVHKGEDWGDCIDAVGTLIYAGAPFDSVRLERGDWSFIAESRTLIPKLAAVVRKAVEQRDEMKKYAVVYHKWLRENDYDAELAEILEGE